jgi:hypothetical protein
MADRGALISPYQPYDPIPYASRGPQVVDFPATSRSRAREPFRRFGAKPRKNFVDDQAASPSSWKTPRMAIWMAA